MDITSDATSSGVFLGQDRRPRLTWRILLAWLGFFGCVLIIGMTVQAATARLSPVISYAAAGLGITASALGLVLLLRRHADRRPWSGIGLTLDRAAIPRLLFGIVLAAIVTTVAAAATVQLGLADWGPSVGTTKRLAEQGLATTIIMIAISTLLVQGFPEELVFRGYMFRNLGETLPLWATVASSSLIFGLMHVFSNSEATTLGERVLYAVSATGFGLMLASCRAVSNTRKPASQTSARTLGQDAASAQPARSRCSQLDTLFGELRSQSLGPNESLAMIAQLAKAHGK